LYNLLPVPSRPDFQNLLVWCINCVITFLLFPVVFIKIILREKLSNFGLNLHLEKRFILLYTGIELFFRGLLIHAFKHKFGYYSILFSVIPYCMIHFGKPLPETIGAVFAGLILGFLSLNTGSIVLGILLHCGIAVTMDFLALGALFSL
jgi:membrane protease YdiL (CAAX protease family)